MRQILEVKPVHEEEQMKNRSRWSWVLPMLAIPLEACLAIGLVPSAIAATINLTFLQLNDVYEITPVEGGTRGGLARVATLRQQLLQQNPRTYTILAGDALSPSALGTAQVNGKPIAGAQMVAVMNAVGLNYATFGNHEFDLNEAQFRQRLKESRFIWLSSNVSDATGKSFAGVPRSVLFSVAGEPDSTGSRPVVRVGLIGLTLNSNQPEYVRYQDAIESAKAQVRALRGKADIIVAITHLALEQDQQLAQTVPEIDLILGGHEHENIQQWRGRDFTPIFKADANARTVYVHKLAYDTTTRKLTINSHLQPITDTLPDQSQTVQVVKQWLAKGFAGFRAKGFEPEQVVTTTRETLDGLEASVRNGATNLTDLIAKAMLAEVETADLAIFNGGSVRIDDTLPPGAITQYDIIRVLPFGGKVLAVEMPGSLLTRVLTQGQANRGTGGFLQTANVTQAQGGWLIAGNPIEADRLYRVAINDFLMTGREAGLDFLTLKQPGIRLIAEKRDIRLAVIEQLKAKSSKALNPLVLQK